jgi:hypothetical protein
MYRHVPDQLIHERLAAMPAFLGSGALNAVDEFYNRDHG